MSIAPYMDGVITAREVGPGLIFDGDYASDDGLVVLRANTDGETTYLDRFGRICAVQKKDELDWFLLTFFWVATLAAISAGLLLARRIGDDLDTTVGLIALVVVVFAAGCIFATSLCGRPRL